MMQWLRRRGWLVVLAALAIPAQAECAAPELDEVFEQIAPLPAGGTFTLANVNGSVTVEGWDRNEVRIRAVKKAGGNAADLRRVHIDVATEPGVVRVATRYPEDEGVEVSVDYVVHVPRRVVLASVYTVNGNVAVREVEGAAAVRAVNGDLDLAAAYGHIQAQTTNGNVRYTAHRGTLPGSVLLDAINGSIVVALPEDAHADLEVTTMNGDFRSELPLRAQGAAGNREFRARLGRGGSPLQVRTVNGGIRVVTTRSAI